MIESWLEKLREGYIEESEVRQLIFEAHRISLAYLRMKLKRGDFLLELVGGSYEDLAWDCISEIFVKNGEGDYSQLSKYLKAYGGNQQNSDDISAFRRMIFTKTNDTVFSLLGRYDSSLSKIIRNIKLAAKDSDSVHLQNVGHDSFLVFHRRKTNGRPVEPELLQTILMNRITAAPNIRKLFEETVYLFDELQHYGNMISIVQLAALFRDVFTRLHHDPDKYQSDLQFQYHKQERERFIQKALTELKPQLYKTYVEKNKLSSTELEQFMRITKKILINKFVTDSTDDGYYEFYCLYFENTAKETYRSEHRAILEYLVKKVESRFLHLFKQDFLV